MKLIFPPRHRASAFIIFLTLIISALLPSCKTTNPTFDALSQIEGTWEMKFDGAAVYEVWHKVNDTLYAGESFEVSEDDTVVTETLNLICNETGIYYIPTVNDQNDVKSVSFKLTTNDGGRFVFENPTHDFPTEITYDFLPGNKLNASVSGIIRGEKRSLDFEFVRVK